MRTNGTYRTPVHGMSTLAPRNRMRGQAEQQINFRSDPVNKLTRRPPSMFDNRVVAITTGGNTQNSMMHSYRRGGKTYKFVIVQLAGTPLYRLVAYENNIRKNELNLIGLDDVTNLKEEVQLVTVKDTTFVLNKNRVVESVTVEDNNVPVVSYLNVLSALNYGEKVQLRVRWYTTTTSLMSLIEYTVPSLGDPPDYDTADEARGTNAVAESLKVAIQDLIDLNSNPLVVSRKGSVVSLQGEEGVVAVSLEIVTGQGDRSIIVSNAEKQDLEGLPLFAIEGSKIKVKPRPTSDRGTYYLRAEKVDTVVDTGDVLNEVVWVESRSNSGEHKIKPDTMPSILTFDELGNVVQEWVEWEDRLTGDDDTNKLPSFVGRTISSIGTHQNRLILTSGNTVSMSRTDNLFNFFRESVTRLLVSDPVDVSVSAVNVDVIEHIVPHNRDLIFNSNNAQFKLDGNVAVTPETVSIPQVTSYDCQSLSAPVGFGNAVLFPMTYGSSSGLLIYNKDAQVESDKATQITHHVQGLMQGKIKTLRANSTLEMAVVLTTESDDIYVYEQYTEFNEARQRSWSVWKLPKNYKVHDVEFVDNKLDLLVSLGANIYIWSIIINSRINNDNDKVYLDSMFKGVVNENKRVVTPVGMPQTSRDDYCVVMGEGSKYPLTPPVWSGIGDNDIDLSNDPYVEVGDTVLIGLKMKSSYIPTRPFRWTEAGQVVTTDKLRVSRFTLSLVESADVSMRIKSEIYPEETYEFNSRIVGGLDNLVGVQPFTTGDVQFSFSKEADLAVPEFFTKGYLPLTIAGISWFGQYHEPSRRM